MITEKEYRSNLIKNQHGELLAIKREVRTRLITIVVAHITNIVTYVNTAWSLWEEVDDPTVETIVITLDLPALEDIVDLIVGGGDDE